jgi:homoserine kinase type II
MGLQREIVGDLLDTADLHQVRRPEPYSPRLQDALAAYSHAEKVPAFAVATKSLTARVTDWLDSRAEHAPVAAHG